MGSSQSQPPELQGPQRFSKHALVRSSRFLVSSSGVGKLPSAAWWCWRPLGAALTYLARSSIVIPLPALMIWRPSWAATLPSPLLPAHTISSHASDFFSKPLWKDNLHSAREDKTKYHLLFCSSCSQLQDKQNTDYFILEE